MCMQLIASIALPQCSRQAGQRPSSRGSEQQAPAHVWLHRLQVILKLGQWLRRWLYCGSLPHCRNAWSPCRTCCFPRRRTPAAPAPRRQLQGTPAQLPGKSGTCFAFQHCPGCQWQRDADHEQQPGVNCEALLHGRIRWVGSHNVHGWRDGGNATCTLDGCRGGRGWVVELRAAAGRPELQPGCPTSRLGNILPGSHAIPGAALSTVFFTSGDSL